MRTVDEMGDYFFTKKRSLESINLKIVNVYMSTDLISICKNKPRIIEWDDNNPLRFAGVPVIEVTGENYFEVGV